MKDQTLKVIVILILLLSGTTLMAQSEPPADAPYITMTVSENATIHMTMAAAEENTPVWIETSPGNYIEIAVGVSVGAPQSYTVSGTVLKVHGELMEFVVRTFLQGQKIMDLDVSHCTDLEYLDCMDDDLTDLDVSQCVNLKRLVCANNYLTELDVSHCVNLEQLNCSNNNLTYLDVSDNVSLSYVDCNANALENLDFGNIVELQMLSCSNNQLTYLDVHKQVNLESIRCFNNQLNKLDLDDNVHLKYLDCYNNTLDSLSLKNPELKDVSCSQNPLTYLDISNSQAVTFLLCKETPLAHINLEHNTALTHVLLSENQLDSLDLSYQPNLSYMFCDNNALQALNLANGHNELINSVQAYGNPNLYCIQVDDGFDANANASWDKDETTAWNNDSANPCGWLGVESMYKPKLKLYPNPTKGVLYINAEISLGQNLQIMDINGKILYQTSISSAYTVVDISHLLSGMYFVKIDGAVQKLIVE